MAVVFFSALAGFAFAKLHFRGRKLLFVAVIATMLVPVQLGVIPLYIEMIHFGWANHLQAVIAPNLATAFGVFLMRQYIVGSVPNELIDAARVDGCYTFGVFWHVILPAVRPVAAVLGLLTFMTTWNDFFWPLVVLGPRNPTVQVAVSTLASGYVAGLRARPDRHVHLDPAAARRLPRARPAHHQRDHARSGQGMSVPARFRLGSRDRRVPDRGRRDADGRGESIWDRFCRDAGQGRERRHRRPGLRPLPPLAGRPRPDGLARRRRLPVLDRLAAHPARRARPGEPARGSTSTAGSSRACSSAGSRRSRRSTTGTCRSASRTTAAGPRARSSTASPTTRGLVFDGLGDLVDTLDHAQRALGDVLPRLRLRRQGARASRLARRSPRRTTCCSRTGAPSRLPRRRRPRRDRHHARPDARDRRARGRRAGSTATATAGSSTRSCAAAIPRTWSSSTSSASARSTSWSPATSSRSRADRLPRRQLLPAGRRPPTAPTGRSQSSRCRGTGRARRWAGRSSRRR